MNDKNNTIEDFISDNRAAFDSEYPSDKVWDKIQQSLPATKKKPWIIRLDMKVVGIAASLLILLGVGVLIGLSLQEESRTNGEMLYSDRHLNEYKEAEQFFVSQVDNKLERIKALKGEDKELENDLKQLDDVFGELRQELVNTHHGNAEQVVSAMIMTYQAKIDLLERVLNRIEYSETDTLEILKNYSDEIKI